MLPAVLWFIHLLMLLSPLRRMPAFIAELPVPGRAPHTNRTTTAISLVGRDESLLPDTQFTAVSPQPLSSYLCECAQVTVTKDHRLSGINNRNLFSRSSGGWKSATKVSPGLVSPEASPLVSSSPCVLSRPSVCICVLSPVLIRTPVIVD